MAPSKLTPKRDKNGYYRNVGYLKAGSRSQPKIMLGASELPAVERLARIMQLWSWVQKERSQTVWGGFLPLAKAIGRGETQFIAPDDSTVDEGAVRYALAIADLADNPVIPVIAENEAKQREGHEQFGQTALPDAQESVDKAIKRADWLRKRSGQPTIHGTLHHVLNSYEQHLKNAYYDVGSNTITDHGKTQQRQCKTLMRLLPDVPLSNLDFQGLDEVYGILRNRPNKEDGTPYARKMCQHLIATLTHALDYADTSPQWSWELPRKHDRIKRIVRRLDIDNAKHGQIAIYSIDELATIWRFARVRDKVVIALALNCGMGADQIGRLSLDRLFLNDDEPSYIHAPRYKRNVIGKWTLWSQTKQLIQWAIKHRPDTDNNLLLVNSKGNSFYGKSEGGDRSRQIANLWYRVLDRIKRKTPTFPRYGFNTLRDTSGQLVRNMAGGELASVHLAHEQTTNDPLLKSYTNPNFERLGIIHQQLEPTLQPLWGAVPNPTIEPPRPNSSKFAKMNA